MKKAKKSKKPLTKRTIAKAIRDAEKQGLYETAEHATSEVDFGTDELETCILEFFGGDKAKTKLWFETPNPLLGGISPAGMIRCGRYDKLIRWVKQQLAENQAPQP